MELIVSISITDNTKHKLTNPSEEISQIFSAYSPKLKVALDFDPDLDMTQQEFKEESDINSIMARYMKTGLIDFVNQHQPQYGDATGFEFNQMQDQILSAKNMFADLPANIRSRFGNNPAEFLDFFNDPDNAAEAARMGLLAPEKAEAILNPKPVEKNAPEPSKPSDDSDKK